MSANCASVTGNRLPYAAENVGSLALAIAADRWRAQVEAVYTGAMYSDDLNTVAVSASGQRGLLPGVPRLVQAGFTMRF